MGLGNEELLSCLNDYVKTRTSEIFYGKYMGRSLQSLCEDLVLAINICIGPSDMSLKNKICEKFLTSTLPRAVDIFLRRKTERYHVDAVASVLMATSRLLAQPASHEIPKLCELRNHLLTGSSNYKFITLQDVNLGAYARPMAYGGFFMDHGRPEIAIINMQNVYFWPSDWEQYLGGENAIGHFVSVFVENKWSEGEVTAFDSASGRHRINVLTEVDCSTEIALMLANSPSSGPTKIYSPSDYGASIAHGYQFPSSNIHGSSAGMAAEVHGQVLTELPDIEVDLRHTVHTWTDLTHRQHIKSSGVRGQGATAGSLLSYSSADVGRFVRVYWPNYSRDYYGRVLSYDPAQGLHTIAYEDKDVRGVCMTEKDYSVIEDIPDSIMANIVGRSHGTAALIVSNWHKNSSGSRPPAPSNAVTTAVPGQTSPTDADIDHIRGASIRPDPRSYHGFSYHLADVVDVFFTEGGFSSLFLSLRDCSLPPPDMPTLILHMKLVYAFRLKVQKTVFRDLAWNMKEIVPLTLLRYQEAQIKTITKSDLNIVLCGLKDIIMLANPKDFAVDKDLAILNLTVAVKLIQCTQLQKRYLGLSIVKEEVETALPKVATLVAPTSSSRTGHGHANSPSRPSTKPFNLGLEFIEEWVVSSKIFDSIFGQSLHQELVTKSEFLLVFLSLQKRLTEEQLTAIWQSSLGGHEAVVRIIYQLILRILPVLSLSFREHLFNLLSIVPYADYTEQYLHLLKDYTLAALRISRKEGGTSNTTGGISESPSFFQGVSAEWSGGAGDETSAQGRRGQVVNTPQRQWLGFGVLWQFLQDQTHISSGGTGPMLHSSETLLDLAIQLLVDLLRDDFKDERELVFQSCVHNIKNGVSVGVCAKIIRLALSLYPSANAGWFNVGRSITSKSTTVSVLVERLSKHDNILESIFAELESYHNCFKEQARGYVQGDVNAVDASSGSGESSGGQSAHVNDMRVKVKGKLTRFPHLRGLSERLQLIGFLLNNSTLRLSDAQLTLLWKVYVEEACSVQVADMFITWLGRLVVTENKYFHLFLSSVTQEEGLSGINKTHLQLLRPVDSATEALEDSEFSQCFAEGVLKQLLTSKLCVLASSSPAAFDPICRETMAVFGLKLMLFVNVASKAIKVESDGSWCRASNSLEGDILLWRLCVDTNDVSVHSCCCFLLIELHHRFSSKIKDPDEVRSNFLKYCFTKVSHTMEYLRRSDQLATSSGSAAAVSSTGDTRTMVEVDVLARRVKRYVTLMRLFVHRFSHRPKQFCRIVVISSRSNSRIVDLKLSLDDTIGVLRERVGSHFRVQASNIGLARMVTKTGVVPRGGDNSSYATDKLDKDEATLRSLKFRPVESISVKRIEASTSRTDSVSTGGKIDKATRESALGKVKKSDIILSKNLLAEFISPLNPFEWLGIDTQKVEASDSDGGSQVVTVPSLPPGDNACKIPLSPIFTLPASPLARQADMALTPAASSRKASTTSTETAPSSAARLAEYLGPYLESKPEHFDQLLQMLDGYMALETEGLFESEYEISMAVWEVVQSLPVHQPLLRKLRTLTDNSNPLTPPNSNAVFFKSILDPNCTYQLLYSLKIIDSILSSSHTATSPTQHMSALDLDRPTLEWAWKFINMGGSEHLANTISTMLRQCEEQVIASNCEFIRALAGGHVSDKESAIGVSRGDALVLSVSYSLRIMHKLLMLDSAYNKWQTDLPTNSTALFIGEDISTHIPAGAVLTCFKPEEFVISLMDNVVMIIGRAAAAAASGGAMSYEGKHSLHDEQGDVLSPLQTLIEHSIILMFGMLATSDRCVAILNQHSDFCRFLRAITLRVPGACVRRAGARRVVECCTVLLMKCRSDYSSNLLESEKKIRLRLFHFILHCSVACVHPGFTGDLAQRPSNKSTTPSAAATSFQQGFNNLLAPERYRNAGETYSLIACLLTLRSRPIVMASRTNVGSFQDLCGAKEKLTAANSLVSGQKDFDGVVVPWTEERDLCELFMEKLFTHHSQESYHSTAADSTLTGILHMLLVLAHSSDSLALLGQIQLPVKLFHSDADPNEKTGLIRFLFSNCLFPQLSPTVGDSTSDSSVAAAVAVCQTPHSRHLAYALLLSLCRSHIDHMRSLMKIMVPQVSIVKSPDTVVDGEQEHVAEDAIPTPHPVVSIAADMRVSRRGQSRQQWEYDPNALVKAPDAFLGLVNQGATCYMNSFLQQLYHVKRFANGLLAVDSRDTSDPDNEQVLFELQVLFGYLRLSQKNYCDTLSLCKTLKDYDGEPIKLGEQKDANEFAGMLFEKLESNRTCADLLKKCFGGMLVWQTISTETSYRSEREEPYYMLTAEVKDKACLEDSLELYVAGEMLTGDNKIEDSDSGKKVDALRRCALRTLPDVLIVHLKRFEFNLETMNRRKLNDLITFPNDLDMLPYTEEGIHLAESRRRARSHSNSEQVLQEVVEAVGKFNAVSSMEEIDRDRLGLDDMEPEIEEITGDEMEASSAAGDKRDHGSKPIRDRSYYQYQLKGIVTHSGAIDSGHYYSFIKQSDTGKWLEFNDRSVLPFDEESIPSECFGGPTENANGTTTMKTYGAYMLFYERRDSSSHGSTQISPSTSGGVVVSKKSNSKVSDVIAMGVNYGLEEKVSRIDKIYSDESSSSPTSTAPRPTSMAAPSKNEQVESDSGDDADSSDDETTEGKSNSVGSSVGRAVSIPRPSVPLIRKPKPLELPPVSHKQTVELFSAPVMDDVFVTRRNRTDSMLSDCDAPEHHSNWKASVVGSGWSDMSDLVVRAIWSENTEFVLDKARFSVEYFLFYAKLLEAPLISEILNDISLADDVIRDGGIAVNDRSTLADYVSTIVSHDMSSGNVLARLVVSSFEFCVQVLSRARAHQCMPFFVEKLEEIIMRDAVGICPEVLLTELSKDPDEGDYIVSPSRTSHGGDPGPYCSTREKERLKVERSVHPLLITIFVECPHTFTISSLSRLLMWCVKMLRPTHAQKYSASSLSRLSGRDGHTASTSMASSPPSYVEMFQQREQQQEDCSHYVSCVSRFIGKLLLLLEYFRPEDAIEQQGYEILSDFLMRFACLGQEEKQLLIQYGAIYRVACSVILLNSVHLQMPSRDCLRNSTDLAAVLVKAASSPPADERHAGCLPQAPGESSNLLCRMSSHDLHTFTTRAFLDIAIPVSSEALSGALCHICSFSEAQEVSKMLSCLNDKVLDIVFNPPPRNEAVLRLFFSVLSDLLMLVVNGGRQRKQVTDSASLPVAPLPPIRDREWIHAVLNDILPVLISRTSQVCQRRHPGDAEYVYGVYTLLYRLGMQNETGFAVVMSLREQWKNFSVDLTYRPSNQASKRAGGGGGSGNRSLRSGGSSGDNRR